MRVEVAVATPRVPVFGDTERLQQVVWNLVNNAPIVLSADRFATDKARALGARGCHVKPIDFDRLRTDIDTYC